MRQSHGRIGARVERSIRNRLNQWRRGARALRVIMSRDCERCRRAASRSAGVLTSPSACRIRSSQAAASGRPESSRSAIAQCPSCVASSGSQYGHTVVSGHDSTRPSNACRRQKFGPVTVTSSSTIESSTRNEGLSSGIRLFLGRGKPKASRLAGATTDTRLERKGPRSRALYVNPSSSRYRFRPSHRRDVRRDFPAASPVEFRPRHDSNSTPSHLRTRRPETCQRIH